MGSKHANIFLFIALAHSFFVVHAVGENEQELEDFFETLLAPNDKIVDACESEKSVVTVLEGGDGVVEREEPRGEPISPQKCEVADEWYHEFLKLHVNAYGQTLLRKKTTVMHNRARMNGVAEWCDGYGKAECGPTVRPLDSRRANDVNYVYEEGRPCVSKPRCVVCAKTYRSWYRLQHHKKEKHEDLRIMCPYCMRLFAKVSHLRDHGCSAGKEEIPA